jgi:hypothetical protein
VLYVTSSTVLTPRVINTTYYVIKLSSTTMKLATSRANAVAGTAIDLTGTGNNSQYFVWFPQSDFGQLAVDGYGGMIRRTASSLTNANAASFSVYNRYAYGFGDVNQLSATGSAVDSFGIFLDRFESRGYFVTQKMFSPNVTDVWQALLLKVRNLKTEHDKIIVKYRTSANTSLPAFGRSSTTVGTWVDANTFTTDADLSMVTAGMEVEFILGAGSGYLAHVSSISLNGTTYTVNLDEDIRGITAADTCYFVIDNWTKLSTAAAEDSITSVSNPDRASFPIAQQSKWIQFKVELRGQPTIAIEELELVNQTEEPA